jgi:hypothetical protein
MAFDISEQIGSATWMLIAHRIALDPTDKSRTYFARASGVARFAWNWALAEWQQQYAARKQNPALPRAGRERFDNEGARYELAERLRATPFDVTPQRSVDADGAATYATSATSTSSEQEMFADISCLHHKERILHWLMNFKNKL